MVSSTSTIWPWNICTHLPFHKKHVTIGANLCRNSYNCKMTFKPTLDLARILKSNLFILKAWLESISQEEIELWNEFQTTLPNETTHPACNHKNSQQPTLELFDHYTFPKTMPNKYLRLTNWTTYMSMTYPHTNRNSMPNHQSLNVAILWEIGIFLI